MALAAIPLFSQSKDVHPARPEETTVFLSNTRLVVLHATVVDKSGKFVTNLTQRAFHVFENNVDE
jgi:hypothetical protein